MPIRYFHGTRIAAAVECLSAGGALMARRPEGASRFARSRNAAVYLTPSFNQASEYAYLGTTRRDWPAGSEARVVSPHVFAFDLANDHPGVPCEDELGWAVMHALLKVRGQRSDWSMNDAFATAFDADPEAQARLLRLASGFAAPFERLGDPAHWRGSQKTRAGAILAKALDPDARLALVRSGISVSHPEGLVPVAGYLLERRVMRADDAVEIPVAPMADRGTDAFAP